MDILIYSDSLSWGIIPNTRNRLAYNKRWTGIFENELIKLGKDVRVIENCLNGRRTAWDDPFKKGRNSSIDLAQVIEMHSPLKLVILMLGTNDFQCTHNNNAFLSAQGILKLIKIIKSAPIEPNFSIPKIMIIVPPKIIKPEGSISYKFNGAEIRFYGLSQELKKVAKEESVLFFDASSVTQASIIDGIHLDENQHKLLGKAIAQNIVNKI